MSKWKKDDWCYYQFELYQILEVDNDGNVTVVTNGSGETSGNLACFPLTIANKYSAELTKKCYNSIRDEANRMNLNYPEIINWFNEEWEKTCLSSNKDEYNQILNYIKETSEEIINEITNIQLIKVEDIRLFR